MTEHGLPTYLTRHYALSKAQLGTEELEGLNRTKTPGNWRPCWTMAAATKLASPRF